MMRFDQDESRGKRREGGESRRTDSAGKKKLSGKLLAPAALAAVAFAGCSGDEFGTYVPVPPKGGDAAVTDGAKTDDMTQTEGGAVNDGNVNDGKLADGSSNKDGATGPDVKVSDGTSKKDSVSVDSGVADGPVADSSAVDSSVADSSSSADSSVADSSSSADSSVADSAVKKDSSGTADSAVPDSYTGDLGIACSGVSNMSVSKTTIYKYQTVSFGGYDFRYVSSPNSNTIKVDITCKSSGTDVSKDQSLSVGGSTVIKVYADGKKISTTVYSKTAWEAVMDVKVENL